MKLNRVSNNWNEIAKARVENEEFDDAVKFIDGASLMLLIIVMWLITAFVFSL